MKNSNLRNSNFELIRIYAILIIIINHICQNCYDIAYKTAPRINYFISQCFYGWTGTLGNWLFILLTGYFICTSKFSLKKVFQLWLEIFSINILIGIPFYIYKVTTTYNRDFYTILKIFFPITMGTHWYASTYFIFYFFVPFLNKSLSSFGKKDHKYLIILLTIIGTVIYMIPVQGIFQSSNLYYFILGYYVGSYIRLYNPKILNNQKVNLIVHFTILWKKILNVNKYVKTNYFILFLVIATILVFIFCATISFIRIKLLQEPVLKIINKKKIN